MSEQQLALAAREDPSNHRVVEAWFNIVAADAAQVVEFYNEHHSKFKKTAKLYMCLACKLRELERFDDAIRVVAGALKIAEKENRVEEYLPWANQVRLKCLLSDQRLREAEAFVESIKSANGGHDAVAVELFSDMAVECIISNHLQDGERFLRRAYAIADEANLLNDCIEDLASNWYLKAIKAGGTNEDLEFIRGAVARFPESASLHYYCSQMLYRFGPRDLSIREETKVVVNTKERRVARTHSFSDGKPPIECLAHAFQAVEREPANMEYVDWACEVCDYMNEDAAQLRYLKHRIRVADDDVTKAKALLALAQFYDWNDLQREERPLLREVINMGEERVGPELLADALTSLAYLHRSDGDETSAIELARESVLMNPNNAAARQILGIGGGVDDNPFDDEFAELSTELEQIDHDDTF